MTDPCQDDRGPYTFLPTDAVTTRGHIYEQINRDNTFEPNCMPSLISDSYHRWRGKGDGVKGLRGHLGERAGQLLPLPTHLTHRCQNKRAS